TRSDRDWSQTCALPIYLEPLAIALSRKARRPVKMVMSREEVFKASGPTSGATVHVKMGATKDGRFVAGFAELKYQAGAFQGSPRSEERRVGKEGSARAG